MLVLQNSFCPSDFSYCLLYAHISSTLLYCHMYLLGLIISRAQIKYLTRDYIIEWKFRYRHNKPSTALINSEPGDGDSRLSGTSVTTYQSTRRIAEALNHWQLWEPQILHWKVFTKRPPQFWAHASFLLTIFPRDTCYSFRPDAAGGIFIIPFSACFLVSFGRDPKNSEILNPYLANVENKVSSY
jgi:hypothetical protein